LFLSLSHLQTDKAVFVKVDTNAQYEVSSKYQVRSLPTFGYFLGGRKVHQDVGGIGEQSLRNQVQSIVRQSESENIKLTSENLKEYYKQVDDSKTDVQMEELLKKCADMSKAGGDCVGAAANQLIRRLKKKYKKGPATVERFSEEDRKAKGGSSGAGGGDNSGQNTRKSQSSSGRNSNNSGPNLNLATKEQLMEELEKRLDQERDEQVDAEEDEPDPDINGWEPDGFPERVVILGGGPAGMSAAIYAARAGLQPLVIAPSMGGQLQGKGVDVENYPALHNVTGPTVVAQMRIQAAHFGAVFEDDVVSAIDVSKRPLRIQTNATGEIESHTVILATGAESNWLGCPGEWELRGGGVSSCATCDGFLYKGKHTVVVGGGDTAMEDALVLARTSSKVTVIHRRYQFRASKVLADRVINHPSITVVWNSTVERMIGKDVKDGSQAKDQDDEEDMDLDNADAGDQFVKVVSAVELKDVSTGALSKLDVDAVFVAIGHTPNTQFLEGLVDFDPAHKGYLKTVSDSTQTSVEGIFAAGDVADAVYRQAITSAGSGAAAALDAERYLSEHGLGNEAAEFEAELLADLMADEPEQSTESYNVYDDAGGRVEGMKESVASAGEL